MRYWIVKGRRNNQDLNGDIQSMLLSGTEGRWVTRKPPRLWEAEDRIFLWSSSPDMFLVGLGILKEIYETDEEGDTEFLLGYLTKPFAVKPGIAQLRADPIVGSASFLKASVAGTLFPLEDDQALRLGELILAKNAGSTTVKSTLESWFPALKPK